MNDVFELSDSYIVDAAALDPMLATWWGIPGHESELTDYSPEGWSKRLELNERTLCQLGLVEPRHHRDHIAVQVMRERLQAECDLIHAGEYHRFLNVMNSHHQYIREVFDFMPQETAEDWEHVRDRLAAVPHTLDGLRASFKHAATEGRVAALRQVLACAGQCETWGEPNGPFGELATGCTVFDISAEAAGASRAYTELGDWLRKEYAPLADPHDPVGTERYGLLARYQNGADLDLREVYDWGWDDLHRIQARMTELVARLRPGSTRDECIAWLRTDPQYVIEGADQFVAWNQAVIDRTIDELDGDYFDIAEPLRRCQAMATPAGGPNATYYTPPTEDFSRPGQTWHPVEGKTTFSLWDALSVVYHEGTPGHHLQLAQMMYQAESLTRYQRLGVFIAGHGEGWALYAEQLMHELGYLDDPAFELGFLVSQALRAARVILDIGLHCEMRIPANETFHPGDRWHADLALPFLLERTGCTAEFLSSEVDRYLGVPGQAISYKVGERVWLEGRERARLRLGSGFDLKHFHQEMLDMGAMGLDLLRDELDSYGSVSGLGT